MVSLSTVLRRNPRIIYTALLITTLFFILLLISPSLSSSLSYSPLDLLDSFYSSGWRRGKGGWSGAGETRRLGLEERLRVAKEAYERTVEQRKGLIEKFGPTADRIDLFPPDVPPWPAYTVWDFFPAAFNCPHEVERIGAMGDGGKWVCGLSRLEEKKDCVIYSFGINLESSFEAELLSRTSHCQIWGYDFSVTSFGPEIPTYHLNRTHFKPYGLSGKDSLEDKKKQMYSLQSLMKMNGHEFVDLVKIDVEGWEFETLSEFLKGYVSFGEEKLTGTGPGGGRGREREKVLPFGQLQLEIHLWNGEGERTFEEFLKWWEVLEDSGLRPFWTEPNLVYLNYARKNAAGLAEYSFLNIRGRNAFISNLEADS